LTTQTVVPSSVIWIGEVWLGPIAQAVAAVEITAHPRRRIVPVRTSDRRSNMALPSEP
jgi:hypothetical protein